MAIEPGNRRPLGWIVLSIGAAVFAVTAMVWQAPHAAQQTVALNANLGVVNGPVTFVTSRIGGTVTAVLVEDDEHVEQGAVLVRLDPAPLQTAVDQKKAQLQVAEAQFEQTRAQVRAQAAAAVADWFSIVKERNQLRQNVAQLRSEVAALKLRQAELTLAESQYQRAVQLAKQRVITADEMEQRQAGLQVAQQQVKQAEAEVQQARASVGLEPGGDGATVPPDLEQKFASIRKSLFTWAQGLARIGFPVQLDQLNPDVDYGRAPGDQPGPEFQHKLDEWIETSPAVLLAQAKVNLARAELRKSELELSHVEIKAPAAGFIDHRSIHPGEQIAAGQTLMAIRSLTSVWIDANIPQSDLERLRIGQRTTIRAVGYPDRTFHGRVAGVCPVAATAGWPTNQTRENAEATPQLPVRIELAEANPTDTPLLIGLTVKIEIDWLAEPSGPDAGRRLQTSATQTTKK